MGIWVKRAVLGDGESLVWSQAAHREQDAGRNVSGRLSLTSERLLFEPNRIDGTFGGESRSLALGDMLLVESEQAVAANAGTLVAQLLVGMSDASVERFTVADAVAAAAGVNEARSAL